MDQAPAWTKIPSTIKARIAPGPDSINPEHLKPIRPDASGLFKVIK